MPTSLRQSPFNNENPPYKRLLPVPFSGACVKFPPPRNQANLVSVAQGIAMDDFVYPVVITGAMSVMPAHTDIAGTGYTIAPGASGRRTEARTIHAVHFHASANPERDLLTRRHPLVPACMGTNGEFCPAFIRITLSHPAAAHIP